MIFIIILLHLAYPIKTLAAAIVKSAPWRLRGEPHTIRRTRVKRYKIPVRKHQDKNQKSGTSGATMIDKPVEPKAPRTCKVRNVFSEC